MNQKNKTQEKLEQLILIVELADKCHRLGLIDTYEARVDVSTEVDYTFSVTVDRYRTDEKKWEEQVSSYLAEQKDPVGTPEEMVDYLKGLIENRRAILLSELEIVEE